MGGILDVRIKLIREAKDVEEAINPVREEFRRQSNNGIWTDEFRMGIIPTPWRRALAAARLRKRWFAATWDRQGRLNKDRGAYGECPTSQETASPRPLERNKGHGEAPMEHLHTTTEHIEQLVPEDEAKQIVPA
ncbi:hypothetical protein E4U13_004829 [Claviceps humidiphila]|uniref:Uncharacterized protein n=1 Tax=Claviceps humidiphila TaxID=1294629 RepID=A0A9P7TRH3_9HYPO|nr:hypothetical protein E4U13_004829 [Claviceps humidiphila]